MISNAATQSAKPRVLPVKPKGIPAELKDLPQWVLWRLELRQDRNGQRKWTKVPYMASGRLASSTDLQTWATFDEVVAAYRARSDKWDGVGFVFAAGGGLAGVDLDGCRDETTRELKRWPADFRQRCAGHIPQPQDMITQLGTYAEVSPSGTGIKLFGRGTVPREGHKKGGKTAGVEMYDHGRFFTVTGQRLVDSPSSIGDCNGELMALHCDVFGESKTDVSTPARMPQSAICVSDAELVDAATNASNGRKFRRLWKGDTTGYASPSEGDLALAGILAFRTGPDPARIEALMRQSGLKRPKWDEHKTYLADTIEKAIKGRTDFCSGNKGRKETNRVKDFGRVKVLTEAICARDHFAQDAGGKLYVYRNGVFSPQGAQYVKAKVKALLTSWGDTKHWSTRLANEVVEFIRVDSPELPSHPRMELVNVENGMLRVEDGVLLPHDPKHLSFVQLPVEYDPAAMCPNIEAFVAATFPRDARRLAWQTAGVLMVPATWLQKAILLIGDGANGKSVWLALLTRFLGRHNVATIPLHRLESDKFAVARLVGKLANICADLPSEHLAGTSTFKALTGGDRLPAEYKFRDSFELEPFARLVFSANHPPRSADSSPAFFRRWVVIPFDHTFGPDEQIPRDDLDAQLQTPEELSGLLNRALKGLRRVQRNRAFSEPESVQAAWQDFHATTDPVAVWLDRHTIDDPDAFCPANTLRCFYNDAAEREGRPSMTENAFGRALRRHRPTLESKQHTVGGRVRWCYVGIDLVVRASRDTRD